jgi:hypothetical protein
MLEGILAFILMIWGGLMWAFWSWGFLAAIFIWGIWGELDDEDDAFVRGVASILISLFSWKFFGIPDQLMIYYAIAYIPIGFVWSFWRYRVWTKYKLGRMTTTSYTKEEIEMQLGIKENSSLCVAWVTSWPLGLPCRLFQDIILFLKDLIVNVFKGVYNWILRQAMKGFDFKTEETLTEATGRNPIRSDSAWREEDGRNR